MSRGCPKCQLLSYKNWLCMAMYGSCIQFYSNKGGGEKILFTIGVLYAILKDAFKGTMSPVSLQKFKSFKTYGNYEWWPNFVKNHHESVLKR